jgi:hypothetical protein
MFYTLEGYCCRGAEGRGVLEAWGGGRTKRGERGGGGNALHPGGLLLQVGY